MKFLIVLLFSCNDYFHTGNLRMTQVLALTVERHPAPVRVVNERVVFPETVSQVFVVVDVVRLVV